MNLPNSRQRRKIATDMGLFGKNKPKLENQKDNSEKSKVIGKLIHLRNLTEQRNRNKKSDS